jgi:hypothetical protein
MLSIVIAFAIVGTTGTAYGWTDHPFNAQQDELGEWSVTTFTPELNKKHYQAWADGKVYAISIKYVKGQKPILHLMRPVDPYIIKLVTVWLDDFLKAIKREMPELKQVVLTFYYPINEISSHTYREAFKNKEIHVKLAQVLNEQRTRVRGE